MPASRTNLSDLLSRPEVAARSRVSVRTWDRLVSTGNGPALTRIGAQVFVREQHYETWLTGLSEQKPVAVGANRANAPATHPAK